MSDAAQPIKSAFEPSIRNALEARGLMQLSGAGLLAAAPARVEVGLAFRPELGR